MRKVDFDLPSSLEPRLQARYQHLVQAHLRANQALSPGASVLPGAASALACTQAAWRFYSNENAPLPALMEPVLERASQAVATECDRYGLVADDWLCLTYNGHASKADRVALKNKKHRGYDLQVSLLLSDRDGHPIAPVAQDLRAEAGLYSTRAGEALPAGKHLDGLTQRMEYLEGLEFKRPLVHIVDRESDSVGHYRQWQERRFLVRAKGRQRVESFFKLLKSAGLQVERWQQQTGQAIARRLVVASMACVVVWQLACDPSPEAEQSRRLLVRLSGRQMKRDRSWTTPALLDGLWVLLAILDLLEHEDMGTLLQNLAQLIGK